ncbi:hypothetical protein HHI36_002963 [Cryptolaemus montrouzieri]|uniref:Uncharacterized protein n=1 Tax=Cryptolaemus montrouzieri TaxID=559131 RepID=A0ABD2PCU5_9CUCU
MLLKPFEEVTKITSSTYSSISDDITHVTTFSRYLQKEQLKQHTSQVDDLRQSLQDNLNFIYLSTLLVPQYKSIFHNSYETENARKATLGEALQLSMGIDESEDFEAAAVPELAEKRSRLDAELHNLFWACFEEAAEEPVEMDRNSSKNSAAAEIDHYLNSTRVRRNINPISGGLTIRVNTLS